MQDSPDYQRGLENARADAKQGWTRCWLPAQELAEQAVYSPIGLSDEELGYAAGLDEAFPGGLREISSFLDQMQTPGTLLPPPADGQQAPEASVSPVHALATVAFNPCCSAKRAQASVFVGHRRVEERVQTGPKKLFLVRFMYLYTHTASR